MLLQFKTKSGSLYEVEGDENGGTWKRLEAGPGSNGVRTDKGEYNYHTPIRLGLPVVFTGPPLIPDADTIKVRYIRTNLVTEIKEVTN
jgi:hypothetical protein